jgi:hypothetical protein
MPRRHGDMQVNEEVGYYAQWWRTELGAVQGNSSGWAVTNLGTITMPWAGQAIAELHLLAQWSGHQQLTCYVTGAPAAAQYSYITRLGANQYSDMIVTVPLLARWDLAAGQSVAVQLQTYVGGGGSNVTLHRVGGEVRGTPA